MPDSDNDSGGPSNADFSSPKEQDRFLPIANVSRIMKKALPANAKISKDAKETVQECVSEFISFITGEASDKCQREKRKTINGDDLLWAMTTLGFEDYMEPLKLYLHKFRELEGEKAVSAGGVGALPSPGGSGSQQRESTPRNNGGGGEAGGYGGMYGGAGAGGGGGGMFMMMGQPMYGSPPAAGYQHPQHHHQMMTGGQGGYGYGDAGAGGGSSSSSGFGRQDRA
ncbi:nuclear transcription factor Y subunit B-10-like [Triticum dicoccoides]|uniref:nuclear transcription factor Y subunit B-10-like n=1 Tax=Triticum dicoccoides TaxID=85692 RepID=UPI000E799B7A|nr:nuclear transcription factor Y subunit B-10-like [Triticum dicoccoides]